MKKYIANLEGNRLANESLNVFLLCPQDDSFCVVIFDVKSHEPLLPPVFDDVVSIV